MVVAEHVENLASGPFRPKKNTAGRTQRRSAAVPSGRRKRPSIRLLHLPLYPAIHRAAAIPRKKVITVVVRTVFSEISNGARYDSVIIR
jgi:hypothetical protein